MNLSYSNEHQINIIPQKDFEDLVHEVFDVIATNLSRSLGPLGSSATIFNGGYVEATKDGYDILKRYTFNNIYKKMVLNLIKAPCEKLNNTVGDGTTTAIALTNAIYQSYRAQEARISTYYRLPRTLTKTWDDVTAELIERVRSKAKPLDPEDYDAIYNLAYVVSNGNEQISSEFAETYKTAKSPAIKIKDSPSNTSYIKPVDGFEFPCNAIDPIYVRNQDLTATETNVATVIFDHTIETDEFNGLLIKLNDVMRAMGHKLIVIAPAYDAYMCDTVVGQYVNYERTKYREINMVLTQYNNAKLKEHQRSDLAVVLKSKPITQDIANGMIDLFNEQGPDRAVEAILEDPNSPFTRCIGKASSVLVSCKNGCIFQADHIEDDEFYKEALRVAHAELDDIIAHTSNEQQSYASKIYDARSRILQLEMKNFIYYVGANTDLQKQILEATIDDVIKCLQSATKNGVVPGCQLSVILACKEMLDESATISNPTKDDLLKRAIIVLIMDGCLAVYQQVLIGPNGDGIIKTLPRWEYTAATDEAVRALNDEAMKKLTEIIRTSLDRNEVWDLETEEYNPKIITSAETDIMVLTAAADLIKILISGNQCVFVDASITESHQDTVETYV